MRVSPLIRQVAEEIRSMYKVERMILYNEKHAVTGETTSFKLCLVMDTRDKAEAERRLYLTIDCDVPYDLLIYTPAQWDHLKTCEGTFAWRVDQTGSVVDE
ncbi:hypothetical protein [Zongyangia hominis]|uniref:Uncharacterized protein n=1 Tax=Zongyangia hominis TaxID=2763677 RepID=A0A926ECF8_9FIRM|nr:hypothetical protein [Zongyangia hominis]MBC8570520.1 hypothetical protein [Zongyangia hominis]